MPRTDEVFGQEEICAFLKEVEGSVLRAWIKRFDPELELRVTETQFGRIMREIGFAGNAAATFANLDDDKSLELCFEELSDEDAKLWRIFRDFCSSTFDGAKDMHAKLSKIDTRSAFGLGILPLDAWTDGLRRLGWTEGSETLLFEAIEEVRGGSEKGRFIEVNDLKWCDIECRRKRRRDMAKEKASVEQRRRTKNSAVAKAALDRFKRHLRKSYHGSYIRAWRCALSPGDTMSLQKIPFFKACVELGWRDVKLLWQALGKDEVGTLALDELDARSAVILAHFQALIHNNFGSAREGFEALDKAKIKKIRFEDFSASLKELNFNQPHKTLFLGLDKEHKGFLIEEDMLFLDRWRPPAFLTANPNPQAAQEIKEALLNRYKYYLKAWRRILDVDSSNSCTWFEFTSACKRLGYRGDVAGAWRHLDSDMSGAISLKEIDWDANEVLLEFLR